MWFDTLKDYMILILGIVFGCIELFRSLKKEKSKKYILILLAGIILLIVLGIDQINRNRTDKTNSDTKIESLIESVNDVQKTKTKDSLNRINDSIKNVQFHNELFKKFNIIDSANYPIKNKNFTTNIDKARDVYIGSDK